MPRIIPRSYPEATAQHLAAAGFAPLLARIYAARGIENKEQLDTDIKRLLSHTLLKNAAEMARLLADAIAQHRKILVVADYDADGATACAVAVRGLSALGAQVDFIVPNRFEYGYGLTPEIVRLAAEVPLQYGAKVPLDERNAARQLLPQTAGFAITSDLASVVGSPSRMASSSTSNVSQLHPDIILTVDNGISSVEGVAEAKRLGMQVLVTDHHLPGDTLPDALCIVNPNQPGCTFPSKNLAGVGVMFYVLMALRAEMRERGAFAEKPEPNLGTLLDLVALGTVADVVKLDDNNRILVQQGLQRIRAGRASKGIEALLQIARKSPQKTSAYELGFVVGPRLNAAGRLEDMGLGIRCLLTDDAAEAAEIAAKLDELNRERRAIEADMQEAALAALEQTDPADGFSLVLFDEAWHQGVIGILASRLKDKFHRPVIAFARASSGELKGSGRSISGLHLRDALDLVAKRHPHVLQKFGGHAMAAGLTLSEEHFDEFQRAFESVAQTLLSPNDLEKVIETDGELEPGDFSLDVAHVLEQQVWGQGFSEPLLQGDFRVQAQRIVGEKHLKLTLGTASASLEAMHFFSTDPLPEKIRAVYSLGVNEYNGRASVQLIVRHWQSL
jgi:single-stranded-DNA-specific exonuclease